MKATVRKLEKVTILDLSGKLIMGVGDVFLRDKIRNLVEEGEKNVILTLSNVRFIDACGLGQIIQSYRRIRDAGGNLAILNISGKVNKVLNITGISQVIKVFDDEKEAIDYLLQPQIQK